jgi:acyl-CoA thioesterase-1
MRIPGMRRKLPTLFLSAVIPFLAGCSPAAREGGAASPPPAGDRLARETEETGAGAALPASTDTQPAASVLPPAGSGPLVVFLGDSLTAGQGVEAEEAFPALLGRDLGAAGNPIRPVNAGVSGDTTAGGLSRLPWLLRQKPDLMVVELGANDGLRGLPLRDMEANLRQIVEKAQGAGAKVLLLGMQIPPNYGPDYAQGFADVYPRLARDLGVPLVPFLLEGVGGVRDLNQGDGIHPTAKGHEKLAATVRPYLEKMITR